MDPSEDETVRSRMKALHMELPESSATWNRRQTVLSMASTISASSGRSSVWSAFSTASNASMSTNQSQSDSLPADSRVANTLSKTSSIFSDVSHQEPLIEPSSAPTPEPTMPAQDRGRSSTAVSSLFTHPPSADARAAGSPRPSVTEKTYCCPFCNIYGISAHFKRNFDCKRHILNFHCADSIWVCSHPGCRVVFDFKDAYVKHFKAEHTNTNLTPDEARVELRPQLVFACGFPTCKENLFEAKGEEDAEIEANKFCEHITKHFEDKEIPVSVSDWEYSVQMQNLLNQGELKHFWRGHRGKLQWHPRSSCEFKKMLECRVITDTLQTFLIAINLASSSNFSSPGHPQQLIFRLPRPVRNAAAEPEAAALKSPVLTMVSTDSASSSRSSAWSAFSPASNASISTRQSQSDYLLQTPPFQPLVCFHQSKLDPAQQPVNVHPSQPSPLQRSVIVHQSKPNPAQPYGTLNIFSCTSCDETFRRKYDWKLHAEEFHERWKEYPCPESGCNSTFWRAEAFNTHHELAHRCKSCSHSEKIVRYHRKRKYWACGFCSALHPSHERHLEHVSRHFESGKIKAEWQHSRVIYGLLHQPLVHEAWKTIKKTFPVRQLSWDPRGSGRHLSSMGGQDLLDALQDMLEFFSGGLEEAQYAASLAFSLADIVYDTSGATMPQEDSRQNVQASRFDTMLTAADGAGTGTEGKVAAISAKRPSSDSIAQKGLPSLPKSRFSRFEKINQWFTSVDTVDPVTADGDTISELLPEIQKFTCPKQDTPLVSVASSQEGTDSVDSDMLSISESSEESETLGLYNENEPTYLILREAVQILLQSYNNIKRKTNQHQPVTEDGGQGPIPSTTDASSHLQSSKFDFCQKRRRIEDDEEEDLGDDGPSRRGKMRQKSNQATSRLLACPYWKRDPDQYRRCCKLTLRRIRDVKQHLQRRHTPEFYCEKCFTTFLDYDSHEHHVVKVSCQREPHAQLDGISHSQHRQLSKKSNPAFTEQNQWFAIWDILFPGSERPFSAYIDSELSADLCLFREHFQNSGHEVLLQVLRSNQWAYMSPEEQDTQGRRILREGLNRIYEDWLSSRSGIGSEMAVHALASSANSSSGLERTRSTPSSFSDTQATSVESFQLSNPAQILITEEADKEPGPAADPTTRSFITSIMDEQNNSSTQVLPGSEESYISQPLDEINMDALVNLPWDNYTEGNFYNPDI